MTEHNPAIKLRHLVRTFAILVAAAVLTGLILMVFGSGSPRIVTVLFLFLAISAALNGAARKSPQGRDPAAPHGSAEPGSEASVTPDMSTSAAIMARVLEAMTSDSTAEASGHGANARAPGGKTAAVFSVARLVLGWLVLTLAIFVFGVVMVENSAPVSAGQILGALAVFLSPLLAALGLYLHRRGR